MTGVQTCALRSRWTRPASSRPPTSSEAVPIKTLTTPSWLLLLLSYTSAFVSELSTELKRRLRLQLNGEGIGIRALRDALHPAFIGGTLDGRSIALDRLSKVPGGRNGKLHAALLAMIDPELGGATSLAALNGIGGLSVRDGTAPPLSRSRASHAAL